MRAQNQPYSYKPRNPFRTLLALWRVLREDEDANANVEEATIVQFAFNRSHWGRKIARWDLLAQEVAASSSCSRSISGRRDRAFISEADSGEEAAAGRRACVEGRFATTCTSQLRAIILTGIFRYLDCSAEVTPTWAKLLAGVVDRHALDDVNDAAW